ncbi:pimeloyl-ACP methyl ester carboxylesterase [Nocardia sp. GAS34]|uniref:alpha/beta hydrolase n=1 Tax=unclassified Nocardia TaxID=2637762 RepID=UPI003D24C2CC
MRKPGRGTFVCALTAAMLAGVGVAAAVPEPAVAPAGLERFYQQRPQWKPCAEPDLAKAAAQCADITVPLNYAEPQGQTITVAIDRLPATDPAHRRGIMLSNPGGPGGPGLGFGLEYGAALAPDVRARYDLIDMDPRGIGRSTPVDCGWPIGFGLQSAGESLLSFGESVATHADLAARCVAAEHGKLPYITTRNSARDMDVIRAALGENRISYYGVSYGTYLGAVYAQLFPERVDRLVLDSAVNPRRYGIGMIQDMTAPNEAAFEAWTVWTAARDDRYHLGATASAVRATVTGLIDRSARDPIRIGSYRVDDHWMPVVLFGGLDNPLHYDVLAGEIQQLAAAAAGQPVRPAGDLGQALSHMLTAPAPGGYGQDFVLCGDVAAPRNPLWYWHNIEASRATAPVFGAFTNNLTTCAFWPRPIEPPTAVHNAVPALIVQATGDTRTAYSEGVALHRDMTASRLITLQGVAIHGILGRYPDRCVESAINAYYRDGVLPAADSTCTG